MRTTARRRQIHAIHAWYDIIHHQKSLPYLLKQILSMQQLGTMHKLKYLQLDDQSVLA